MSFDVFGIGNTLVDIEAQVSDQTLEQLGYTKGLMTLVERDAQTGVLAALHAHPKHRCAGGSAANTILGLVGFGGRAAYAGKVGGDELGAFCLEDMRNAGVAIDVLPGEGATGTCVVLITEDAQRTMLTHLGASSDLSSGDIDEQRILESKYIYVEGYLWTNDSTRATALHAIEFAAAHDVKIALTASDPFLITLFKDAFWDLIKGPVDLLFCNLEEARSLTGEQDAMACGRMLVEHADLVAVTMGGDGSILFNGTDTIPIDGVAVDAVDTTGAGDMYAAGLLYGLTNGLTLQESGRLASHAAARVVSQLGARLDQPFTTEEMLQLRD
ncbi:MAG: adenosine kinase [Planctomycetaceae bacterium]